MSLTLGAVELWLAGLAGLLFGYAIGVSCWTRRARRALENLERMPAYVNYVINSASRSRGGGSGKAPEAEL